MLIHAPKQGKSMQSLVPITIHQSNICLVTSF